MRPPSLRETDAPFPFKDSSLREKDARLNFKDGSLREKDGPQGASVPPLGNVIPLHGVTQASVRAFLSLPETRHSVFMLVAAKVPRSNVEDLVHDAFEEAMNALERTAPGRDEALPAWLATIARRIVADFLVKRARRGRYEGAMPEQPEAVEGADNESESDERGHAFEPSYDPRAADDDDGGVDAWLVLEWLERQVADHPRDRETLAILMEHAREDRAYQQIARERDMTLTALSSRIFEFKGKYIPRYRRWRNRAVLWVLLGVVALVVAVVLWMLSRPARIGPDPYRIPPTRPPAPSATVSAPEPFEPALSPTKPPLPEKPPLRDKP